MSLVMRKMEERIQLRASTEEKNLLKIACELAGFRNLTTFIMNTMKNECRKVLKEHGGRTLSAKDSEIIVNAIINFPKANTNLKKLLRNE